MDEYDNSCEPMDVDLSHLSTNSNNAMEISYPEIENERSPTNCSNIYTDMNSFYKLIEGVDHSKETNSGLKPTVQCDKQVNIGNFYRKSLLIAFIVCVLSILSYKVFAIKCYEDLNLTTLNETLHTKLYGQTIAIENVMKFLNLKDDAKVLVLYGGTGVGKTFMVSLILEDIFNNTNIYHYSMSNLQKTFSSESMFGITLCKTSVVVIDDITFNNKVIKKYVKELITRSTNLKKTITIILIFNCANINQQFYSNCPNNFLTELKLLFNDINTMKKFVKFEPLTEDSLKKCIQYELRDNILNETDLYKIMKNFNVQRDGCKGVHQKTKYLNVL